LTRVIYTCYNIIVRREGNETQGNNKNASEGRMDNKNQRGSHVHMIHPSKPGKIQIPYHNKDLKPKTLNSILKQAGLK
jgi:YcfA-like protein.